MQKNLNQLINKILPFVILWIILLMHSIKKKVFLKLQH